MPSPALLQGEPGRDRATFGKAKLRSANVTPPCDSARADLRKQGYFKYKQVFRMLGQNMIRRHATRSPDAFPASFLSKAPV